MHVMQSAPGAETVIDGRTYLYFCGTGYLGLHAHPALIAAACEATQRLGLGTATTRAGFGNAAPILEVERQAAAFCGAEAAFYFASGYVGSHVLLSALWHRAQAIFLDECSHYSIADATRCAGLPVFRFPHARAAALQASLRTHLKAGQAPIVMCDGVFAARGTIAPVPEYVDILQDFPGSLLCLDDCHAFGVLGKRGRGTYEHFGITDRGVNIACDARPNDLAGPELFAVGTMSKAFGGYGGILWGSHAFIERVKVSSHYYDGASAPPIPAAAASATALALVAEAPEMVTRVQNNAKRLKRELRSLGLNADDSPVPIVSLAIGDGANMQRIQKALAADGILIAYMSQYSGLGPAGALRIAVFATHTEHMIQRLTQALGQLV
ncbi:MAG: aminotransferase class I/II-fold pyridoxal phosphate-dependent enzyme [Pirellulaceae bacterium]